jgi:hypothetical protein
VARIRVNIPNTVNCPHCHEPNPAQANACASCGKSLLVYIGPAEAIPRRLGLSSLMVLVAAIAPCLVVLRAEPALGVLMLLIIVPAVIRTFVAISTRKADGRPMPTDEKLATFAASLGIVWLIGVAAGIAFGGSYFVSSALIYTILSIFIFLPQSAMHDVWFMLPSMSLGLLAGLGVMYSLGRKLWRFQR